MKMILRQKLWLTFIVALNVVLWLVPSDVVEQIARDERDVTAVFRGRVLKQLVQRFGHGQNDRWSGVRPGRSRRSIRPGR